MNNIVTPNPEPIHLIWFSVSPHAETHFAFVKAPGRSSVAEFRCALIPMFFCSLSLSLSFSLSFFCQNQMKNHFQVPPT